MLVTVKVRLLPEQQQSGEKMATVILDTVVRHGLHVQQTTKYV